MKRYRRFGALAAVALVASLLVPGAAQARAAFTYDVQLGADFFDQGVPGFSLRAFPTSVKVVQGDTLHFFGFGAPVLLPAGEVPQEWTEQNATHLGDDWFQLLPDPDDGAQATKFNIAYFTSDDNCEGSAAAPCVYTGAGPEPYFPPVTESGEVWVTIDANPGDVIWGYISQGIPPLRIEVVTDPADASTPQEVAARASQQLAEDFNEARALHEKFSAKKTWHRDEFGRKVFDVWVGPGRKWIETLAMYPKKISIKKGQRVQYHFNFESEVHTVVMSKQKAFEVLENTFFPQCDPDGDNGPGPDNMPNFEAETELELCPDVSQLEFDLDPREVYETGNGTFNGKASDLESSGLKGRESFQDGFLNDDPYTVKFSKKSNRKGYKYFCTVHGPSMGGRIRVKAR